MLEENLPPLISSSSGQKLPRKSVSFALVKVMRADLQVMITTQHYWGIGLFHFYQEAIPVFKKQTNKPNHAMFCMLRRASHGFFFLKEIRYWDPHEIFLRNNIRINMLWKLCVKRWNLFFFTSTHLYLRECIAPEQRLWKFKFTG